MRVAAIIFLYLWATAAIASQTEGDVTATISNYVDCTLSDCTTSDNAEPVMIVNADGSIDYFY